MGRQHQTGFDSPLGFAFKQVIHRAHAVHIGDLKIIRTMFPFTHQVNVPIGALRVPLDILEMAYPLQRHGDPLEAVSDLNRYRVQIYPTALLKVSELGDFYPVQPNLPSEPPCANGRLLPVILHKTDIMLGGVKPQSLQRLQVDFLRVARVGFQDHLELIKLLQPVGIITVAAVIRADGWLNIGNMPWFRTQNAQKGARVHRPSANLGVIGLPDHAAAFCPERLQVRHNGLKMN